MYIRNVDVAYEKGTKDIYYKFMNKIGKYGLQSERDLRTLMKIKKLELLALRMIMKMYPRYLKKITNFKFFYKLLEARS